MNKTMEQIANHLEFLGYKIETRVDNNINYIFAGHPQNNDMIIWEMGNMTVHRVNLASGKSFSDKMYKFFCDVNRNNSVSRFYFDIDGSQVVVRFHALYTGDYSKEIYGQFYSLFEGDQKKIYAVENYKELFIN